MEGVVLVYKDHLESVKRLVATYELELLAGDVGDVHVVGGGRKILKLLAGEDVDGDQVNLGVAVLASLGGRHVDDLAGAALDDDVTVLAQSRALHGEGERRTGVGGLEGHLMLLGDDVLAIWPTQNKYVVRHNDMAGGWDRNWCDI